MSKINRRKIRQIILEESVAAIKMVQEGMRDYNDPRGNLDRTPNIGVSKHGGPRPDHPFYTGGYNPAGKPEGYDYDSSDDDPMELGRYDGLNRNKDAMLYRDNPDYRAGYDEVSIDVDTKHSEGPPPPEDDTMPGDDENTISYDGPISEMFGFGSSRAKKEKQQKRERAKAMLDRLKAGESLDSIGDDMAMNRDPLGYLSRQADDMAAALSVPEKPESREEKMARLKKTLQKRKMGLSMNEEYSGPIAESKKKKKKKDNNHDEQIETSGKYWYFGTLDKDHEPCTDWSKFGFAPLDEEEE